MNLDDKELNKLVDDYFQVCGKLPKIDNRLLKYLFIFSLNLFYLGFYLRKKKNELKGIQEIAKQILVDIL